jgi:predicted hydrocarbon binding protein/predicted Ser/Thr protein kinase
MHGLIFLQLQKFARQKAGDQGWELLLQEARLPPKSYSAAQAYPDEEALSLVGAASRILRQPADAILHEFGLFIAPELLRLYHRLLRPEWKTLDVIEHTEKLIHAGVRVGNPGATPPVLECIRTTDEEVQIMYSSERQMCALAKGIVTGIARHFGETVSVSEQACMLNGDPFCAIQVNRTTVPAPTAHTPGSHDTCVYHNLMPFSGHGLRTQSRVGEPFVFLKPPQRDDELGRVGEYRILKLIGQGSMGVVFQAEDTRLDRLVALKFMHPHFAADSTMRERFLQEAKAMASIKSEHIVTVWETGVAQGVPFLAMEFLEGDTLEEYHKKVGHLTVQQIVQIGRETAQGLAAAHARGLIHRDIKPSNLWLEAPTGRVKILDFGLARVATGSRQISQVGTIVGTPAFMAPEQARGEVVDYHADLFSLGCVFYLLCTNDLPYKGTDILSTLMALATHDPQPPEQISAKIPTALSDLIMQLLRKEPIRRPESSTMVAQMLAAIELQLGAPTREFVPTFEQ